MGCKACGGGSALEVCLHCGHSFCKMHRDVIDGLPACTACLKEEKARRSKSKPQKAEPLVPGEPVGGPVGGVDSSPKPSAPLPEPKSALGPLVLGAAAAAPSGAYMWWLLTKLTLEHEWPALVPQIGTGAFAAFVFAAVWAIAKSK